MRGINMQKVFRASCITGILLLGVIAFVHHIVAQTGGMEYTHSKVRNALEAYNIDYNAYPLWEYRDFGRGKTVATFKNTALTSPISYLPRMPIDLFSYDENHWYSYYSIKGTREGERNAWILISAAPDQDYDVDAPKMYDIYSTTTLPALINLHYDATNGSISNGDLISTSEWRL